MSAFSGFSGVRRAFLAMIPAALAVHPLAAQTDATESTQPLPGASGSPEETRLPNGKIQRDEMLKADYAQNLKDARDLMNQAKTFELELEKSDQFVLSLDLLKRLDDMEKLTRRIRGRMRH